MSRIVKQQKDHSTRPHRKEFQIKRANMNSDQKTNRVTPTCFQDSFSNSARKEVKMTKKNAMRILLVAGLLVVALLAVLAFSTQSAPAATIVESASEDRLAGSDNIVLNPPVPPTAVPENYYAGSDWIERHPSTAVPDNYYTGSDYCERHSCEVTP
jgi:hypothetical protein